MFLSSHHVHQTQYFHEWVGFRPFKLQIDFYRGQNSSKNTLTDGNWFNATQTLKDLNFYYYMISLSQCTGILEAIFKFSLILMSYSHVAISVLS